LPGYILKRLLALIPVLLGVTFVTFLSLHLVPGDPAIAMLGERASPEAVAELRKQLGLDEPFLVQYLKFLIRLLQGDFGRSIQSNNPVLSELAQKFPATIELAVFAMAVAVLIGLSAGLLAAARYRRFLDAFSMITSLIGVSMPIFWLGLILMILFSIQIPLFPISGRIDVEMGVTRLTGFYLIDSLFARNIKAFAESLRHLVLPSLTLATVPLSIIARMTRSSMLQALSQDYVRTAKAKGLSEWTVVVKHALRNALLPIVTTIGLQFGYLLGGAVLTETIFAWPGLGRLLVDAVNARDYPLVQGAAFLFALSFVFVNLLVDLLYAYIDPRIRYR